MLTELVTEILRSFDYYRSRYRGEQVELVILSGGTARFKNIDIHIANELGTPVSDRRSVQEHLHVGGGWHDGGGDP